VLPNVETHDGMLAFDHRAVLVGGRVDVELAPLSRQPRPARAEASQSGGGEFLLELAEAAEGALEGLRQMAAGLSAGLGRHNLPEHGVVNVATAIVAHRRSDALRNEAQVVGQQLLDGLAGQARRRLQHLIQIAYVSSMMLAMVNLHGHLIDIRFQRVKSVGQRWKCEWHRSSFGWCD